jgi:16S rRNA (guanine527-N7)-methyltransferase
MFHVKHEGWAPDGISNRQLDILRAYEVFLRSEAVPRGMVARSDLDHLWDRHIEDSLRALPLIPPGAARACDLGSGAGLPGIPIAIVRPSLELVLVEARRGRAALLELAVERLRLSTASVYAGRAERLARGFDVCLARGFADAGRCWDVAERLMRPGGRLLYWAGGTFEDHEVPTGARVLGTEAPALESGGPIVIMARR